MLDGRAPVAGVLGKDGSPDKAKKLLEERRVTLEQLRDIVAIAEDISVGYSLLTEEDEEPWDYDD